MFEAVGCDYYDDFFSACERHIDDVQLVFTRDATCRVLYGEPWDRTSQDQTARASRDRADGVSLVHY
jgi:hypothetical protein